MLLTHGTAIVIGELQLIPLKLALIGELGEHREILRKALNFLVSLRLEGQERPVSNHDGVDPDYKYRQCNYKQGDISGKGMLNEGFCLLVIE